MSNIMKKRRDDENACTPMAAFQKRMNELFEDCFKDFHEPSWLPWRASGEKSDFMPRVDVSESEKEICVTAELPGLTDKDVEVTLDHGVLTVKGEKQQQQEDKNQHFHYVERKYGAFYRRIPIPGDVDQGKIDATFKNGLLQIKLPKKESPAEAKKIAVKS